MKYIDINQKFTAKVAEYIAKGYTINTATMSGSQGEVAHVDLTDGKQVVRVLLDGFTEHDSFNSLSGLEIVVGTPADKVVPYDTARYNTIWNNRLEIIDLVVGHHQLFLLHIGQPGHNIAVAGFTAHAGQSFKQAIARDDFSVFVHDQRFNLSEHFNTADILGDLLVGVAADVVRRLAQVGQLLYCDFHCAASFLSEVRFTAIEITIATSTT